MLAAHMDEVGFMLVEADDDGLFRFETVGGMDPRQLVGKAVLVGKDHIPGVIGANPIHLTTPDERRSAIPLDTLRIDLGPGGAGKAKVGDRAAFATRFPRSAPACWARPWTTAWVWHPDRAGQACPGQYRAAGGFHRPGRSRPARGARGCLCLQSRSGHRA